jgi:hypothetical protein
MIRSCTVSYLLPLDQTIFIIGVKSLNDPEMHRWDQTLFTIGAKSLNDPEIKAQQFYR